MRGRHDAAVHRRQLWLGGHGAVEGSALPRPMATLVYGTEGEDDATPVMALEEQTHRVLAVAPGDESSIALLVVPEDESEARALEEQGSAILPAAHLQCGAEVHVPSWLPGENGVLAALTSAGAVELWDMVRLSRVSTIAAAPQGLPIDGALCFVSDALIAVGRDDGTLAVVDTRLGGVALESRDFGGSERQPRIVSLSADDLVVVGGTNDGRLPVWDLRNAVHRFGRLCELTSFGDAPVHHVSHVSASHVLSVDAKGYATLHARSPAADAVVWRTELPCELGAGYAPAALGATGVLAFPLGDSVLMVDVATGDMIAQCMLTDAAGDAVAYDALRDRLLVLDAEKRCVHALRPS